MAGQFADGDTRRVDYPKGSEGLTFTPRMRGMFQ